MKMYNPSDWYWRVGDDDSQVFSSKANKFVPLSDADFIGWEGMPTSIDTLTSLQQVLRDALVPPYAPVTPRQARLALLAAGLLDAVQAAVDTTGGATKITWEFATVIERNSPLIETLKNSLGLTDAQIDTLFKYAATQ